VTATPGRVGWEPRRQGDVGGGEGSHGRMKASTLNVRGLIREEGGLNHSLGLVHAMMEDGGVDIMILTETNVPYRAKGSVASAVRRAGIWCSMATVPDGHHAAGSGVMIIWRPDNGITPLTTETHKGGRGVGVRFRRGERGGERLDVIGLYGVAGPASRRAEADELWGWAVSQTRRARARARASGRWAEIIVGGDMNAV
jgi:hypothetical protein